jgi:hypothetical protein
MGELGREWLRGVGVTVPVTGGASGGNNQAFCQCLFRLRNHKVPKQGPTLKKIQ